MQPSNPILHQTLMLVVAAVALVVMVKTLLQIITLEMVDLDLLSHKSLLMILLQRFLANGLLLLVRTDIMLAEVVEGHERLFVTGLAVEFDVVHVRVGRPKTYYAAGS